MLFLARCEIHRVTDLVLVHAHVNVLHVSQNPTPMSGSRRRLVTPTALVTTVTSSATLTASKTSIAKNGRSTVESSATVTASKTLIERPSMVTTETVTASATVTSSKTPRIRLTL